MTASAELSAAAHASERRIPDFFIVGHGKSGTTALYEMLRRHPQIYMPDVKEPWFFASDLPVHMQRSDRLPTTLEQYLAMFEDARPEQRVGEATPSYLLSRTAAAGIAELQPDARIIAILREPASFLRSLHLQFVQAHLETENDLRKALSLEEVRRQGKAIPQEATRPQLLLYSEHVRYIEQLRRYHAVFSPEQVLILIYDDFRNDNAATVRKVLRFLAVDDTCQIVEMEANPTVRVRSQRLYEVTRSLYMGAGPTSSAVKAAIKGLTPRRLRHDALRTLRRRVLYDEPRLPDEDLMLELRRRFKGEVIALSDYLDRDLVSLWGYDRVG
jgi:hypothetical protein